MLYVRPLVDFHVDTTSADSLSPLQGTGISKVALDVANELTATNNKPGYCKGTVPFRSARVGKVAEIPEQVAGAAVYISKSTT